MGDQMVKQCLMKHTEQLHSDNSLARDEIQCTSVKEEEHEDKHSVKLKQLCSSCSKKSLLFGKLRGTRSAS